VKVATATRLFALFCLADVLLSLISIHLRATEANPFMAFLMQHGIVTFVLGKLAMDALCFAILLMCVTYEMARNAMALAVVVMGMLVAYEIIGILFILL
jgi:hypothetical protein